MDFIWKPTIPAVLTENPPVKDYNFGDGFSERIPIGTQQNIQSWRLNFDALLPDEALQIRNFLKSQGGHRAFRWIPPSPYDEPGLYRCASWNIRQVSQYQSIELTFQQVSF